MESNQLSGTFLKRKMVSSRTSEKPEDDLLNKTPLTTSTKLKALEKVTLLFSKSAIKSHLLEHRGFRIRWKLLVMLKNRLDFGRNIKKKKEKKPSHVPESDSSDGYGRKLVSE